MGGDEKTPVTDKKVAENRVQEARKVVAKECSEAVAGILDAGELFQDSAGEWVYRCVCNKQPGGKKSKGVLKLRRARDLACHVKDKQHFHAEICRGLD
jgi:hypothetical protein